MPTIAPRPHQVKPVIGFQFVALPSAILPREDMSLAAKVLLAVLMDASRGSRSGMCKLCNATLGARIDRSASEVGRHLAELEAMGMIRRVYGASKRIRVGVAITWVPDGRATPGSASTTADRPGSAGIANPVHGGSATLQTPAARTIPDGTASPDPREEERPSPAEVAAALRSMVAGRHAPALFAARPAPAPPPPPDVRAMAKRVGYSAVAAIQQTRPHRKTAARQLAELAAWSRRVEPPPSPAPPPRRDEPRPESPRIPHTFGDLAKGGKL